jgi:hypothetical protein
MKYYTIQSNGILIADNRETLIRFYNNVLELPEDYEHYKYIVVDNELILNPNWEKEQEEKERKRIKNLKCTKRVFVLMLEKMGLDYFEQIEPLINNNRQAKLEWELCVELERSNNLLDILATELGVTSRQLDLLFQYANGEDVKLEVVNG